MSIDLVELRMLLVSPDGGLCDLIRQTASTASVPLEVAIASSAGEVSGFAGNAIDIVAVDDALAPDHADIVKAVRAGGSSPALFAICPDAPAGMSAGYPLRKPSGLNDARALVERCIRARVPTRVLVVDDSVTIRSIVRKVLSGCSYAFDIADASEGREALTRLREDAADLVILDYNMPGLNGFETLVEIRKAQPDVGVVMMTASPDKVVVDKALREGAVGFLGKPFYPADIEALLDRYFASQIRPS